jgi:hypothetical protein
MCKRRGYQVGYWKYYEDKNDSRRNLSWGSSFMKLAQHFLGIIQKKIN